MGDTLLSALPAQAGDKLRLAVGIMLVRRRRPRPSTGRMDRDTNKPRAVFSFSLTRAR